MGGMLIDTTGDAHSAGTVGPHQYNKLMETGEYKARVISLPELTIYTGVMDGEVVHDEKIWTYEVELL
jgi:hypothetical protein